MPTYCSKLQRIYGRSRFSRYADFVISHKNHDQKALVLENNIPYSWHLKSQCMVALPSSCHCKQNSTMSKHQMSLLSFVIDVFLPLHQSSKPVLLGRKKRSYSLPPLVFGKKPTLPKPLPDTRYDLIDHFPEFTEKTERDVDLVQWVTTMQFATNVV